MNEDQGFALVNNIPKSIPAKNEHGSRVDLTPLLSLTDLPIHVPFFYEKHLYCTITSDMLACIKYVIEGVNNGTNGSQLCTLSKGNA
jgi:hypothetical protein